MNFKPPKLTLFKWSDVPQRVEQADAASRLTIEEVNSIGTEKTGISLPLIPSVDGKKSIASYGCWISTDLGVYNERHDQNQAPQLSLFDVESIFEHFYHERSPIYNCQERGLESKPLESLAHGPFMRRVCEDEEVERVRLNGGCIYCATLGWLHSLPIVASDNSLVEWDACDEFGNVYALKAFHFVGDQYNKFLFPFRPSVSGIGELQIDLHRTPQIILNPFTMFVIRHPKARHTWLSLRNGFGMDWSPLKGWTCGLWCNGSTDDWNEREMILSILAHAAEQGVSLSLVDETQVIEQDDFVAKCKSMGMDIPSILSKHNLLVQKSVPSLDNSGLPLFWGNGPVTVFSMQKSGLLNRAFAEIDKNIQKNYLLVIPEDSCYRWRRTIQELDKLEGRQHSRNLVTDNNLSDDKAFRRAVSESRAEIVLMAGYRQGKDTCIHKVLNWCGECGLPVGVFYDGDGNEVNEDDFCLYDNVFNVSRVPHDKQSQQQELSFGRRKPEPKQSFSISDIIAEIDKPEQEVVILRPRNIVSINESGEVVVIGTEVQDAEQEQPSLYDYGCGRIGHKGISYPPRLASRSSS